MKQIFLGALVFLVAISAANAQDYLKQLKKANRALGNYYMDPVANKDDLTNALKSIDEIFTSKEAQADPDAWNAKGQIYNEIARAEMNRKVLDPSYPLTTPEAGLIAQQAFEKALSVAVKKSQKKDALVGLKENEDHVNNIGITFFQVNDYDNAFKNFKAAIQDYEILKERQEKSRLDDAVARGDHYFYTAAAGYLGKYKQESYPYFLKLYEEKYPQPLVYEALFTLTVDKDEAKAMQYLEQGKTLNPDDSSLLFAEINYYLRVQKLDALIGKLEAAIKKEPDNVSVYTTMGNVYDQLNQNERAQDNIAKADEYFDKAMSYFNQAVELDPKSFDAVYSQGALYYNKAASLTSKLNALSDDITPAGTKKYNDIKKEMDGYFLQAKPYFEKAEKLDPNDVNVKIALKEIYAREGDFEKSNQYKLKLESMGGN
ncbi:MAG: hypothetical protein J5I52_10720 [Saprospiraceae bacterium]|nr:MAG: TPR domain-containing protein [Bacteroidetes bacterium OLB9]MCO6464606.1 hypothetical protein [Saprospiraceae bacterium]MCZ2336626.1 hypothetical protein [Chitinophagales bacterium]